MEQISVGLAANQTNLCAFEHAPLFQLRTLFWSITVLISAQLKCSADTAFFPARLRVVFLFNPAL